MHTHTHTHTEVYSPSVNLWILLKLVYCNSFCHFHVLVVPDLASRKTFEWTLLSFLQDPLISWALFYLLEQNYILDTSQTFSSLTIESAPFPRSPDFF